MATGSAHRVWHGQGYYRYLLWALVGLLVIYPVMTDWLLGRVIVQIATVGVLVTGILAVYKNRSQIALTVVAAAVTLLTNLAHLLRDEVPGLTIAWLVSGLVFFLPVTWALLRDIFSSRGSVTGDLLYGAVSVYLLIGMNFANAHFLLETAKPGSYQCGSPQCSPIQTMATYLYFSYITLATVGYGEITPATRIAGMLTYVEAITGQMYVAILVARLVGMQISQSER